MRLKLPEAEHWASANTELTPKLIQLNRRVTFRLSTLHDHAANRLLDGSKDGWDRGVLSSVGDGLPRSTIETKNR
jgi:hypothetical protein